MTQRSNEFSVNVEWRSRTSTRATVTVRCSGDVLYVGQLNPAKEKDRKAFLARLQDKAPAVKKDADDIEDELMRKAAEHASDPGEGDETSNLADRLVKLASAATLFHDVEQRGYATIEVDGRVETLPIRSQRFRLWLRRRLREEDDRAAYRDALAAAIEEVDSLALFEREQMNAHVRLAQTQDGTIWLDLADEDRNVVRITPSGWRVMAREIPVNFIRPRGMLPLPVPDADGSIDDLRPFLNVHDEVDFDLIVGWILASLRPRGPFPILIVNGEQGTAKSTLQRFLRSLIDPNSAPLRSEPADPRDLVISAENAWILSYDNLSRIPPWLSDALCRLSTGGGYATRALYTDRDEVIFESQRPVMFNGIGDLATRSDLLDRSVLITLSPITEDRRRDERGLRASFDAARPKILGALLDGVAAGLANLSSVKLHHVPRMADFAIWVVACEKGLSWQPGTFLEAYTANRSSAHDVVIESSMIGPEILSLLATHESWEGNSTELLAALEDNANEKTKGRRSWPANARKLSSDLRRIAPNLRATGIDVTFSKTTDRSRKRLIILGRVSVVSDDSRTGNLEDRPSPKRRPKSGLFTSPDDSDGTDGLEQTIAEEATAVDIGESLLEELSDLGITANVRGDKLELRPGSRLPPDAEGRLLKHKPAVIRAIRLRSLDDDRRAAWDERVAIGVSDGGLSLEEAEEQAWRELNGPEPMSDGEHQKPP